MRHPLKKEKKENLPARSDQLMLPSSTNTRKDNQDNVSKNRNQSSPSTKKRLNVKTAVYLTVKLGLIRYLKTEQPFSSPSWRSLSQWLLTERLAGALNIPF